MLRPIDGGIDCPRKRTPARLVFVPEGSVKDHSFFSGISKYFGQALANAANGHLALELAELPLALEIEEILRLAYGPPGSVSARLAAKLEAPLNMEILEVLRSRPNAVGLCDAVEVYWRRTAQVLLQQVPALNDAETAVLALSPFFPRLWPRRRLFFYLDCVNTEFFFAPDYGTLKALDIPPLVHRFLAQAEHALLESAEAIFCFSRAAADQVHATVGVPRSRLIVVGAGANQEQRLRWCPSRRTNERPLVVFVGRDLVRKGGDLVLAVAARMPQVRFVLVTDDDVRSWLPNVRIRHDLPHRKVRQLMHSADLFVFPTRLEPFGLVLLEAMRSGTAVITTGRTPVSALLPRIAVLDPDNITQLQSRIELLLGNRPLRTALRRRGLDVSRQLTWRHAAHSIVARIDQASKGGHSS